MAVGDMFFNSGLTFDAKSGQRLSKLGSGPIAATRDGIALASRDSVALYQWAEVVKRDRRGKAIKSQETVEISEGVVLERTGSGYLLKREKMKFELELTPDEVSALRTTLENRWK